MGTNRELVVNHVHLEANGQQLSLCICGLLLHQCKSLLRQLLPA
jgi:hypothetical protein